MNEYYVYVYLDPRKKGNFNYNEYSFEYEPFYVGKGKKSRYLRHLKTNEWNPIKNNKINKIKSEGHNPIIVKVSSNLSNEEAVLLEIDLIRLIGKITSNKGPLTNVSDGGESYTGYKHKQYFIDRLYKPVTKYDLIGNIIDSYSSVKEAGEKNGVSPQTISSICSGTVKIWKNKYIFLYSDKNFENRLRDKKEYSVMRIDYENNITIYKSITEASIENNINLSKIGQVCMGERFQSGGFLWKYTKHPKKDFFDDKIQENFGKYFELMNKQIKDDNGVVYKNILHILSVVKNAKVNNIFSLIKSKKSYKIDEHKRPQELLQH